MSENTPSSQSSHLDDVQLNEYLDGYLPENQIVILEKHLDTCPHCAARLDDLQAVFSSLESLPDASLERDLSIAVISTIQPAWKLPPRWKWGALIQFVFAFVVMLLAVPSLSENWHPFFQQAQQVISTQILERWITFIAQWSALLSEFELRWTQLFSDWQTPSILENTQVTVWPLFFTAILLFLVGNGLVLRKISRNGIH